MDFALSTNLPVRYDSNDGTLAEPANWFTANSAANAAALNGEDWTFTGEVDLSGSTLTIDGGSLDSMPTGLSFTGLSQTDADALIASTAAGRTLLTAADAAAQRSALSLDDFYLQTADLTDDDTMATAANDAPASGESVKAYVDYQSVLLGDTWIKWMPMIGGVTTGTGGGVATINSNGFRINSVTTAGALASVRYSGVPSFSRAGETANNLFGGVGKLDFSIRVGANTTNGIVNLGLGYGTSDTDAYPTSSDDVLGIEIRNLTLYGVVAASTTPEYTASLGALTINTTYRFRITWVGSTVTWYSISNTGVLTQLAITSNGPTTGALQNALLASVTNGADAAQQYADVSAIYLEFR